MIVDFIENTPLRVTLEPVYFQSIKITTTRTSDTYTLKVPPFFFYDSASIPRIIKFLDDNTHEQAYLIHDFLYSKLSDTQGVVFTRKQADLQLFNDLCGWERYIIYAWVRLFGWYSWKKDYNYNKYKTQIEWMNLKNSIRSLGNTI